METFGRSDLGGAEERLRRVLQLEGRLPIAYAEATGFILPTLRVGDGLGIGANSSHNRAWQFEFSGSATGNNIVLGQASADGQPVIIDAFEASILGGSAGDFLRMYQYNGAPVVTPTSANVPWVERFRGDLAPILTGSGAGVPAVAQIGTWNVPVANALKVDGLRICLDNGVVAGWRFIAAAAGTLSLVVRGRIF